MPKIDIRGCSYGIGRTNERNLNKYQRSELALEFEDVIREQAKEKQFEGINQHSLCQKSDKPTIDTKKELGKIADVSHDTI